MTSEVVVVTGAGRGLGRLYAIELARRGARVVVNDVGATMAGDGVDERVADLVVADIAASGGSAVASYASVDTPEGGEEITETALRSFGDLSAVVSNAGIFGTRPFEELGGDEWRRMVDVHLHGAFHVAQPAYRVMKERGSGRFVFVSSSAGAFGQPNSAHYAAAKAGVVGLANVIAIEGAEHGILANCVLPFGSTRMVTETVGDAEGDPGVAELVATIRPELVVPIVVHLASRSCTSTHEMYSAGAGRFARVFVGLGDGWQATDGAVAAEDLAEHWSEISATDPYLVPSSIYDEVARLLG